MSYMFMSFSNLSWNPFITWIVSTWTIYLFFLIPRVTRNCWKKSKYNAKKVRIQRYSIHSRRVNSSILSNILIFSNDVCSLNREQLDFIHRVRDSFILRNNELVRCVFERLRSLFICRIIKENISGRRATITQLSRSQLAWPLPYKDTTECFTR